MCISMNHEIGEFGDSYTCTCFLKTSHILMFVCFEIFVVTPKLFREDYELWATQKGWIYMTRLCLKAWLHIQELLGWSPDFKVRMDHGQSKEKKIIKRVEK